MTIPKPSDIAKPKTQSIPTIENKKPVKRDYTLPEHLQYRPFKDIRKALKSKKKENAR